MSKLQRSIERLQENDPTLTYLGLQGNEIKGEDARQLAYALGNNSTLTSLDLYGNEIKDEDAMELACALEKNSTLTCLNMGNNMIGVDGATALAGALEKNSTLTELRMGVNEIGVEGAGALARALEKNSTLTELHMGVNEIGFEGAMALARALEMNSTLTELHMGHNNIGAKGARALARALETNTTDNTLYLSHNNIGAEGAMALAGALEKNTTINTLHLSHNNIGAEGARAIADALEKNSTLTYLQLQGNNIGAEGARALAEALKENYTLTSLNLDNNNFGAEGAMALADALEKNSTLTGLRVGNNNIGAQGAGRKIISKLERSMKRLHWNDPTLTSLGLHRNEIKGQDAMALAGAPEKNSFLTKLHMGDKEIGAEGVRALAVALEKNNTLTSLDLSRNNIEAEGARALASALEKNTVLTDLYLPRNNIGDDLVDLIRQLLKRNKTKGVEWRAAVNAKKTREETKKRKRSSSTGSSQPLRQTLTNDEDVSAALLLNNFQQQGFQIQAQLQASEMSQGGNNQIQHDIQSQQVVQQHEKMQAQQIAEETRRKRTNINHLKMSRRPSNIKEFEAPQHQHDESDSQPSPAPFSEENNNEAVAMKLFETVIESNIEFDIESGIGSVFGTDTEPLLERTDNDILKAPGGNGGVRRHQYHPGNIWFREIILSCYERYRGASMIEEKQTMIKEKQNIVNEIITKARYGGRRFLKLSQVDGKNEWVHLTAKETRDLVSSRLRSVKKKQVRHTATRFATNKDHVFEEIGTEFPVFPGGKDPSSGAFEPLQVAPPKHPFRLFRKEKKSTQTSLEDKMQKCIKFLEKTEHYCRQWSKPKKGRSPFSKCNCIARLSDPKRWYEREAIATGMMVFFAKSSEERRQLNIEWIRDTKDSSVPRRFFLPMIDQVLDSQNSTRFCLPISDRLPVVDGTKTIDLRQWKICKSALGFILDIGKDAWATCSKLAETKNQHGDGVNSFRKRSGRGKTFDDNIKADLDTYMNEIAKLAKSQSSKALRDEIGQFTHRNEEDDVLDLPTGMSKRSIYEEFCRRRGHTMKKTDSGYVSSSQTQEAQNIPGWSTFLVYWNREYRNLRVGEPIS